jgi:predicted DCC family thiol-disulfide oxidoreductase YuxK
MVTPYRTTIDGSIPEPRTGWVLYDGDCGVCSRWVTSWEPKLLPYGLSVAPLQSPWVEERTGLKRSELLQEIRLLEPDGTLHSGANVYRFLMRRIWWAYPMYLLSLVPGLRLGFDWAYRTFARHRMRISASCGLPGAP